MVGHEILIEVKKRKRNMFTRITYGVLAGLTAFQLLCWIVFELVD